MMRATCFAVVAGATLLAAGAAQAAVFFTDSFDYADGNLTVVAGGGANVSGGLWAPHSGTGFPPAINVVNGEAVLNFSGSEDANRAAGATQTFGDTWYYAAAISVKDLRADPAAQGLTNDYFMHFKDGGNNFRGRAYIDDPNVADPSKYTLGLSSSGGGQTDQWPVDLEFGALQCIVVSYDFLTGASRLWVNPTDVNSPFVEDVNGALAEISSLALRQGFLNSGTGTPEVLSHQILVDAVSIGTTFDEVLAAVSATKAIPEPSTLVISMIGMIGVLAYRRRALV